MSTYEIREALDALKTRALAESNGLLMEQYARATLEVEAIERAAKAMNEAKLDREKLRTTARLMQSIAKDAP